MLCVLRVILLGLLDSCFLVLIVLGMVLLGLVGWMGMLELRCLLLYFFWIVIVCYVLFFWVYWYFVNLLFWGEIFKWECYLILFELCDIVSLMCLLLWEFFYRLLINWVVELFWFYVYFVSFCGWEVVWLVY